MAAVELNGVSKSWASFVALSTLDLSISDGEFVVLLGPSGCGKTTTMRIIAGLMEATTGHVRFDGVDVTQTLPKDRNVAMVFQNYALYPHMTVAQNIAYPLRIAGLSRTARDAKVAAAAEQVDLGDYLDRYPKQLSGGQRQRVALARALVRNPAVFLMDEPLSNLDAKLRVAMRAEIKQLQRRLGVTTVYVTHDQIEALTLADRIVVMNKGKVQQIGTPDEIYSQPANLFVAGFIGSPPMNFVPGAISEGRFKASEVDLPSSASFRGDAILGFRAEDAFVDRSGVGPLRGEIYAVEPTGDATLLVVRTAGMLLSIREDKSYRPRLGEVVSVAIRPGLEMVFDKTTERRVA